MKKNPTTTAQIIIILGLLTLSHFEFHNKPEIQGYIYKLVTGLGIAILISTIVWGIRNFHLIKYFIKSHLPFLYNKPIRLTVAYLFRIELDGQYLLVKNRKGILGFQPVGGVYKYLRRENAEFFDSIELIPDTKIKRDIVAEDDLRMQLKKRYHLLKFIRWFAKKKHREVDPWREFYEELVNTGILSHENFPHIQYRYVKQHSEMKYSKHHQIMEYKVADIYELQFTNESQKDEIRELANKGHSEIIFASSEEIKLREKGNNKITEHTYKII